jgi:hypothetical protein
MNVLGLGWMSSDLEQRSADRLAAPPAPAQSAPGPVLNSGQFFLGGGIVFLNSRH